MMKALAMVSAFVSFIFTFSGCGGNANHFGRFERDLSQALARYENSESKFGSSASYDQLIVNAGWLERMAEAVVEIEEIEARAVAKGSAPITDIRQDIARRFRTRIATFKSDAKYLDVMSELEIARIWADL